LKAEGRTRGIKSFSSSSSLFVFSLISKQLIRQFPSFRPTTASSVELPSRSWGSPMPSFVLFLPVDRNQKQIWGSESRVHFLLSFPPEVCGVRHLYLTFFARMGDRNVQHYRPESGRWVRIVLSHADEIPPLGFTLQRKLWHNQLSAPILSSLTILDFSLASVSQRLQVSFFFRRRDSREIAGILEPCLDHADLSYFTIDSAQSCPQG